MLRDGQAGALVEQSRASQCGPSALSEICKLIPEDVDFSAEPSHMMHIGITEDDVATLFEPSLEYELDRSLRYSGRLHDNTAYAFTNVPDLNGEQIQRIHVFTDGSKFAAGEVESAVAAWAFVCIA